MGFLVLEQTECIVDTNQIKTLLTKTLTPYMIPEIVIVDHMPLLINGKINRQQLLKSYSELQEKSKYRRMFNIWVFIQNISGRVLRLMLT